MLPVRIPTEFLSATTRLPCRNLTLQEALFSRSLVLIPTVQSLVTVPSALTPVLSSLELESLETLLQSSRSSQEPQVSVVSVELTSSEHLERLRSSQPYSQSFQWPLLVSAKRLSVLAMAIWITMMFRRQLPLPKRPLLQKPRLCQPTLPAFTRVRQPIRLWQCQPTLSILTEARQSLRLMVVFRGLLTLLAIKLHTRAIDHLTLPLGNQ